MDMRRFAVVAGIKEKPVKAGSQNSAGIFLPGQTIRRERESEILKILTIPKIPVQTFSVKLILRESF